MLVVSGFFSCIALAQENAVDLNPKEIRIWYSPTDAPPKLGLGFDTLNRRITRHVLNTTEVTTNFGTVARYYFTLSERENESNSESAITAKASSDFGWGGGSVNAFRDTEKTDDVRTVTFKVRATFRSRVEMLTDPELNDAAIAALKKAGFSRSFNERFGIAGVRAIHYGGMADVTIRARFHSESAAKKQRKEAEGRGFSSKGSVDWESFNKELSKNASVTYLVSSTSAKANLFITDDFTQMSLLVRETVEDFSTNPQPYLATAEYLENLEGDPGQLDDWKRLGGLVNGLALLESRRDRLRQTIEALESRSQLWKPDPTIDLKEMRASLLESKLKIEKLRRLVFASEPSLLNTLLSEARTIEQKMDTVAATPIVYRKRVEFNHTSVGRLKWRGRDTNLGRPPYNIHLEASARLDHYARGLAIRLLMKVKEVDDGNSAAEFDNEFFVPIPEWIHEGDFGFPEISSYKLENDKWKSRYSNGYSEVEARRAGWKRLEFRISTAGDDRRFTGIIAKIQQDVWIPTRIGAIVLPR